MKLKRLLLFGALVMLAAVVGIAVSIAARKKTALAQSYAYPPGYTLRSQIFSHGRLSGEETVSMFANGDYRVQKRDGNHVYGSMRIKGKGFFSIDDSGQWIQRDERVRYDLSAPVLTVDDLRSSPEYVKDDTIIGITSVMTRTVNPSTGKPIAEMWRAPATTGFWPLRIVLYNENSGEESLRVEPAAVDHAEPDPSLLTLPNYRIAKPRQ